MIKVILFNFLFIQLNKLFNPKINVKNFYDRYNGYIEEFYENLKIFLQEHIFDKIFLKSLLNNYVNIYKEYMKSNFCNSKDELNEGFSDPNYIDFFYKILIYNLITNKIEQIKNIDDIQVILKNFWKFLQKIKLDNELKIYQKIFALIQYNYIIKKYNSYEIFYIKCNKAEENSVIDLSLKFLKD